MKKLEKVSDEELVEMVRSQDQELYSEIVRRYQERLVRYGNYLLNNQAVVEDVVQEAFIKAFVNLKGFDTKRKFSSWIYRIVHNEAINEVRKRKKEISLEDNGWVEELKGEEGVEETLEKKEISRMIKNSLEKLPLTYREPLALYYIEEKSYEEISDVLRMPVGTVGTRINRGKKILRRIYEEDE